METSITTWVLLGIIFILFIVSSIILIFNTRNKQSSDDSIYFQDSPKNTSYWKTVKGSILQSRIDYREHKTFFISKVRQYRTRITYEYFAFDHKHKSETTLNHWTTDKDIAKDLLDKHRQGHHVIVRFHPKSPETSVIELNR